MSEQLGSRMRVLTGHEKPVRSAAALPGGERRALSSSFDHTMRLAAVGRWDQIVKAIEERFGGLAEPNARANATQPVGRHPNSSVRRVPHAFRGLAEQD